MSRLEMFRVNIHFLIGIICCGGIGLILVLFFWTAIRAWLFHRRISRTVKTDDRSNLPMRARQAPVTRGICERCGQVREEVYFLSTGERLCVDCLKREQSESLRR